MQYSLTFLSATALVLLPALAAAQSANTTTTIAAPGNLTITNVPSTITSFPTLTPTHSFPNSTNSTATRSSLETKKNVTSTITASDGSLSTATSLVVVTGGETSSASSTPAATTTASSNQAAGDAAKKIGNSFGAFVIAMGVLFVGHLL